MESKTGPLSAGRSGDTQRHELLRSSPKRLMRSTSLTRVTAKHSATSGFHLPECVRYSATRKSGLESIARIVVCSTSRRRTNGRTCCAICASIDQLRLLITIMRFIAQRPKRGSNRCCDETSRSSIPV